MTILKIIGCVVFAFFAIAFVMAGHDRDRGRCYRNGGSNFGWDCTDANGKSVEYTKE